MVIYTVYACKQMVDRRRISKRELDQRETCGMGREGCFMYAVYQKQMIGKRRLKKRNGIKKKKRGEKKTSDQD